MARVRSLSLAVSFFVVALAAPSSAAVLQYQGFKDMTTIGMASGVDLLVGTSDDTASPGFNTGGDLAHNFTFFGAVTGGTAFTSLFIYNDAPDLGSNGTSMNFTADGVSVDNTGGAVPFFYEDDATQTPHSVTLTQNGREYSYAYTIESCASSDPSCSAPLTSIDHQGVGLIMLPGDNPTTIYNNATTVNALYDALVPMGQGDVPAYLTQLAAAARRTGQQSAWQCIPLRSAMVSTVPVPNAPVSTAISSTGSSRPTRSPSPPPPRGSSRCLGRSV